MPQRITSSPPSHEKPPSRRLRRTMAAMLSVFAMGAGLLMATQPAAAETPESDFYGGTYSADLSPTPPMGFNAWLSYKCDVSEDLIIEVVDNIVELGLQDVGYEYINLDDCWEAAERDADGRLQSDPVTFPSGMQWLGEYIHSKGLKFGIYSAASEVTCKGRPASHGFYETDMQTFADWGVDYIKMDICGKEGNVLIKANCDNTSQSRMYEGRYREIAQGIKDSGRDMILAVSAPASIAAQCGYNSVAYTDSMEWTPHYGQVWRTARDAGIRWESVAGTYEPNVKLSASQSKGHWNDADMLMVGSVIPLVEQQTQFDLWAAMAAPMLISTDLSNISPEALAILTNEDIIAINQDPLAVQGTIAQAGDGYDVLVKPLANGDQAVVLFNKGESPRTIVTDLTTTGMTDASPADAYTLKNLVTGDMTSTTGTVQASVPAHGTVIYRVSAGADPEAMPSTSFSVRSNLMSEDGTYQVVATLSNDGGAALTDIPVSLSVPSDWTVTPASQNIATLAADSETTVAFTLASSTPAPAGTTEVPVTGTAEVSFAGQSRTLTANTTVVVERMYDTLAQAFNSTVISADDATTTANFDGAGNSYSANALAELGATPGAALTVDGASLLWPDVEPGQLDNVAGSNALIRVPGEQVGSSLVFLGAGQKESAGDVTVYYHDGTSEHRTLTFPNWKMDSPDQGAAYGAQPELVTTYRNTPKGPANFGLNYVVYSNSVELDPTKSVAAVRLTGNPNQHIFSFGVVPVEVEADTVRPVATLVSPAVEGPFRSIEIEVEASDAGGLERIVANVYQGTKLVKSTQTAVDGATEGRHTATVELPDGAYTVKYNAHDLGGNVSKTGVSAFTVDTIAPKATIKTGTQHTVETDDSFDVVSFKLYDAGKIDRVEINGTIKDLSNNTWSDVNYIKKGVFGAVQGLNTLVAYDVAGNTATYEFTLN